MTAPPAAVVALAVWDGGGEDVGIGVVVTVGVAVCVGGGVEVGVGGAVVVGVVVVVVVVVVVALVPKTPSRQPASDERIPTIVVPPTVRNARLVRGGELRVIVAHSVCGMVRYCRRPSFTLPSGRPINARTTIRLQSIGWPDDLLRASEQRTRYRHSVYWVAGT